MNRLVDIVFSTVGLLVASPVILLVSVLNLAWLGWPVLFTAVRAGYLEKPFRLYKFRSMLNSHGPDGSLLPDDERVTAWGRFLRASSLDELPQLWNVLRGDMSLVGPRPLPLLYLPRYNATQRRRHDVRPGITGWAQVNGRNSISWDEKFKLDVWYVERRNILLDFKIISLTAWKLIRPRGISPQDQLTMPEFTGRQDHDSAIAKKQ